MGLICTFVFVIEAKLWFLCIAIYNGVSRTLKKLRTSREINGSISDSLQWRPFS